MNQGIVIDSFVEETQKEQSILYEPVRKLAPMLFPTLIKDGSDDDNKTAEKETEAI